MTVGDKLPKQEKFNISIFLPPKKYIDKTNTIHMGIKRSFWAGGAVQCYSTSQACSSPWRVLPQHHPKPKENRTLVSSTAEDLNKMSSPPPSGADGFWLLFPHHLILGESLILSIPVCSLLSNEELAP